MKTLMHSTTAFAPPQFSSDYIAKRTDEKPRAWKNERFGVTVAIANQN